MTLFIIFMGAALVIYLVGILTGLGIQSRKLDRRERDVLSVERRLGWRGTPRPPESEFMGVMTRESRAPQGPNGTIVVNGIPRT